MTEKYIAIVTLHIEIEASSASVALLKAKKKFAKHYTSMIDVLGQDGKVEMSINPEMEKPSYLLSPLRVQGRP